jgi:small subunit ribosomal protein S1
MEDKEKNIEETNSIENQEIKNEVEQVNEPEKKEETTEETTEEKAEAVEEKAEVVVEEKEEKNEVVEEKKASKKIELREESFDWDNYDKEQTGYSKDERSKLESIYDDTLSTVSENEVVDGTVIAMTNREVVINIGYKSEGIVNLNEFRYNSDLKAGDVVEVYVESQEDRTGQLILSHKKARALKSWDRVNSALEQDEIIKGFIKCRTKGGMIVDVFGIEAFLPGSQIDVKPIRDYDIYVGKTMEFKVVKINHEFKNVVVSHKALIEAELEQQKKDIIAKLEKGQVLEGTVKNITSYGVFIDLGGVDGLIHITDLSWGRVTHPEEVVELDQN